ncbi:MAG: hypothetical protein H8E26_08800 [FCB group bacterium]|nr:hypothetical protein [FCB group bacterium]MBL7028910.1 hypothetical protein [Candidatus Neomarinimicrobiota bacterium]MBL7122748.1 hypothetical protein [Candidatus Neomarinimicrobiota bacterium]
MLKYCLVFLPLCFHSCSTNEASFIQTYGGVGPDRGIHIIQTSDENFVIVGNTSTAKKGLDVYLLKIDTAGDTLWTRKFGGPGDDNGWCIKETSDKGFIIAGFTNRNEASPNDVLLIKTDAHGSEEWTRQYGGPGDDMGWSIIINRDGGYTIAAQTNSFGSGDLDAYLIRTDAAGDTLWTKTFGGPQTDRVFSIDKTSDDGFVVAGITYSYGAGDRDAYLLKTDGNGQLLWEKTYGGTGYDNAHTVIINQSNEIILTGYGEHWGNSNNMNIFLKKITMDGEEVWSKTYGGPSHDRAMTVFQTHDEGFILTGFTQSFGRGEWDVYAVKTDSEGDTIWTSTYGTPAPDFGYDIIQSLSSQYYITGWSHGYEDPGGDLLIIKTGP